MNKKTKITIKKLENMIYIRISNISYNLLLIKLIKLYQKILVFYL